jgi:tRNA modification GTPase
LWFGRQSFTRQPSAEIHAIGSQPILKLVLRAFCQAGARLARPGEFTLRAFLAGRLDLPQAEAILEVIEADSPRRLETALRQLAGGLSLRLCTLRNELLDLLADLEAGLDFSTEDIAFISQAELFRRLREAERLATALGDQITRRASKDETPRLVLVGLPNSGKSSLFNALQKHSRAIVADLPGTTRDFLVADLNLASGSILLIDTAGLTEGHEESAVDQWGQRQTLRQSEQAHIQIACLDATRPIGVQEAALKRVIGTDGQAVPVITKADLAQEDSTPPGSIRTSSVTGQGLDELRERLRQMVESDISIPTTVEGTMLRSRESIGHARQALSRATSLAAEGAEDELIACEIRGALEGLGMILGTIYNEDILDRVFSRFCIGK